MAVSYFSVTVLKWFQMVFAFFEICSTAGQESTHITAPVQGTILGSDEGPLVPYYTCITQSFVTLFPEQGRNENIFLSHQAAYFEILF